MSQRFNLRQVAPEGYKAFGAALSVHRDLGSRSESLSTSSSCASPRSTAVSYCVDLHWRDHRESRRRPAQDQQPDHLEGGAIFRSREARRPRLDRKPDQHRADRSAGRRLCADVKTEFSEKEIGATSPSCIALMERHEASRDRSSIAGRSRPSAACSASSLSGCARWNCGQNKTTTRIGARSSGVARSKVADGATDKDATLHRDYPRQIGTVTSNDTARQNLLPASAAGPTSRGAACSIRRACRTRANWNMPRST